jgi:hypothetical protein
MLPLEIVGHIEIPSDVLSHRFVIEAEACTKVLHEQILENYGFNKEGVVGTANTGEVELYGWAPNVADHKDNTGLIYLVALNPGKTMVECIEGDEAYSVSLAQGAVLRLDDRWTHWTIDKQERICAFIGSFDEPCDEWAINRLRAAIEALENGEYYGAPRVSPGFRVYGDDECLVEGPDESVQPMLLADAIAQKRDYITCAYPGCDKPAAVMDRLWPHFTDCRCYTHR